MDYHATPPAMSTGRRAMAMGLAVMLLSVSAGMHFGGFALLLCFTGVLIGANLLAVAIRMDNGPARIVPLPVVFGGARALAAFMRRNTAAMGLFMASCAFTAVFGEEEPVLCFSLFALFLLGLSLINIGARGE